jgi:hypothetical protein
MDMYEHEQLHPFLGPGVVENNLMGIMIPFVKCLLIFN